MENTQQPQQKPSPDPRKKAVGEIIKHYEPDAEISDEYLSEVVGAYETNDDLFKSLIKHYEPEAEIDNDYLGGIYDSYGIGQEDVKKKPLPDGSQASATGVQEQSKSNYNPLILAPEEEGSLIPSEIKPDENWKPEAKPTGQAFVGRILNDGREPISKVDKETREPFLNYYSQNYDQLKGQLEVDDKTMQLYIGLAEGIRTQEIKQDNWFDKIFSGILDGETRDGIAETVTERSYGFVNMHESALSKSMPGIDPKELNNPEVAAQAVLLKLHDLFNDPNIQKIPDLERKIDAVTASFNQGGTGETEEGKSYPERYVNNRIKDGGNLDLDPFQTDSYALAVYGHLPEDVRKQVGINPIRETDLYDVETTPMHGVQAAPVTTKRMKPEVAAKIEAEKAERLAVKMEDTYDRFMAENEYVDGQASALGLYKQYLMENGQEGRLKHLASKKEAGKSTEKEELNLFSEAVQFKAEVLKRKGDRLEQDPSIKEGMGQVKMLQSEMQDIQQQAQEITNFLQEEKSKGEVEMDVNAYNQKVTELNNLQGEYKKLISQEEEVLSSEQFQEMKAITTDWRETEDALKNRLHNFPNAYKEHLLQKSKAIAASKEYSENTSSKLYQQIMSPIGHALANSAEGLLSLPRTLASNDEYGWTDWLADQGTDMAGSAKSNQFAQSEIFNQGLFKTTEGEDGVETDEFQAELLPNKIMRTGADMALLLIGAGKIAAPLKGFGMGAKAATGSGLFASSFVNAHNSYYETSIAEGLTPSQASTFALSAGMVTSSLEFINPQKYLIGGSEVKRQVVKEFAKGLASGQSKKAAMKGASKFLTREIVGENIQETSQMIGDKAVEYMANDILHEDKFEEFRGDLGNEFKETVVLTTIVAGLPAVVNANSPMNELQRNSMLTAAMDDSYRPKIMNAFEEAGIDENTRNKVLEKVEVMADANKKIPEVYQGNDRMKILDLMVEMGEIEASIKGKHALFTVSEKAQIKEIKEKIDKVVNNGKVIQAVQEAKKTNEQQPEQPGEQVQPEPVQEAQEQPGEERVSTEDAQKEPDTGRVSEQGNQEVDVPDTNVAKTETKKTQPVKDVRIEVGKNNTSYIARKTDTGIEVINEKTGKKIDRKSKAYDEVVSAYTKENLEVFADRSFMEITEEIGQDEYNKLVAEKSDSPLEVALAWNNLQETEMDGKTKVISEGLKRIPKEGFYRQGDRKTVQGAEQIRTNYFGKDGIPLDTQAQTLSEESGMEITEQDIIDFINEHPGGAQTAVKKDPVADQLEQRFESLTGLPITKDLVNDLAGVESQAEAVEKLNNDLLNIVDNEGITLDNIDSLKDLFQGFPYTEEDFNLIKNYLQNEGQQQETKGQNGSSKDSAANKQSESSTAEPAAGQEGVKNPKKKFDTKKYEESVKRNWDKDRNPQSDKYTLQEVMEGVALTPLQKVIYEAIKHINTPIVFNSYDLDGSKFSSPRNTIVIGLEEGNINKDHVYVILHEAIHAATTYTIERVESGNTSMLTDVQIKAVRGLNELYQNYKKQHKNKDNYSLKNIDEFIAHIVQEEFNQEIKSKDLNFLQKALNLIFDVIGINNAYDLSLRYLRDIAETRREEATQEGVKKKPAVKADFSKGKKPQVAKASTQYVAEVIDRLSKVFPNLPVVVGKKQFDAALKHAKENEPDKFQDGDTALGFFWQGSFYIDPSVAREDTPIHEFAHPFVLLMKEKYPALYNKGVKLVEKSQYYKDIVNSKAYKIPDNLPAKEHAAWMERQKEEAMVTAIGESGANLFKTRYSKETASFRNRLRQYIKDFWNGLRHRIGFPPSIDIPSLTLEQFAEISASELLSGRTITDKSAAQLDYRASFNIPLGAVHPGLLKGSHMFNTDKSDPEFYRSKTQRLRRFVTTGLHDRYFRVTELVEKAATTLTDQNNVAQKMELMKGKAVAIMEKMEEKVIRSKPNSKKKSLFERMKDAGLDIDVLGNFMYALHAPERNAHVAKVREQAYDQALTELGDQINEARVKAAKYKLEGNRSLEAHWTKKQKELIQEVEKIRNGEHDHIYKLPDGGSGMTNTQAKAVIEKLKQEGTHDKYMDFANEFQAEVVRPNLENMVQAGILTQEEFDFLKHDSTTGGYKFYVPLLVKTEELSRKKSSGGTSSGLDVASTGIHSSVGSARYTHEYRENPIDAALTAYRTTAINLEKNQAGQALLKFAQENPDPTIYEIRKPVYMPRYDQDGDISSVEMTTQKGDNEVQVYVDGQVHLIKVYDKDLLRALKDMDSKGISAALEGIREFVGAVHNWLRMVYTGINPEFLITNFVRDLQTALINIGKEDAKGISQEIVKNVMPAMRGIFGAERGLASDKKWNEAYRDLVDYGGKTSWFESNDIKDRVEDLRKELEGYNPNTGWGKMKKQGKNLFQFLQDLNTSVEMAARVAAYKSLIDRGISKDKAASVAKNLTVNFEKKGLFAIFLDTFYLFANAAIQGSAILIKNMATSKAVRQRAFAVTAFSVLVNIWNDAVDEDDEYWMLEGEKERNMIFMLPKAMRVGDVNRLSLPLPYGFNIFKVMGDIAYETATGRSTTASMLGKLLGSTAEAFSPIAGDISTAWVPTLVKPFVEIGLNKNYMGSPIHPEHQQFRKHKKDSERYFKSVSPFAKEVSRLLDKAGGGTELKEGEILGMSTSISPEILEHIGTTYSGGLGKFLLNTATTTQNIIEGEMPNMQSIPIVRQFVKEESEWAASQVIWEMWEGSEKNIYNDREVELFQNAIKNAKESGVMKSRRLRDMSRDFRKSQRKLQRLEEKKKGF